MIPVITEESWKCTASLFSPTKTRQLAGFHYVVFTLGEHWSDGWQQQWQSAATIWVRPWGSWENLQWEFWESISLGFPPQIESSDITTSLPVFLCRVGGLSISEVTAAPPHLIVHKMKAWANFNRNHLTVAETMAWFSSVLVCYIHFYS